MLQLGSNASSHGIKTAPARFFETIVIDLYSRKAADDVMLECFQRLSQTDTFMNAIVTRIVSNLFFIRLVTVFIKKYVHPKIDECQLTTLYAERERWTTEEFLYHQRDRHWTQQK